MDSKLASGNFRGLAEFERKFAIIAAIATLDRPTLSEIQDATGIPSISIRRLMTAVRKEYGMMILFVRDAKEPGKKSTAGARGYYTIQKWGIINKAEFFDTYIKRRY